MNNYLRDIAIAILKLTTKRNLTKVRFAKYIYFAHKKLVEDCFSNLYDMKFIRMPLGPVPVGFMRLSQDAGNEISIVSQNTGLLYDSWCYSLSKPINEPVKYENELLSLIAILDGYRTSMIIELSHGDDSWKSHKNGEEYFVTDIDLSRPINKKHHLVSNDVENQKIQSLLVTGMIEDIIDDSTSLEYPEE